MRCYKHAWARFTLYPLNGKCDRDRSRNSVSSSIRLLMVRAAEPVFDSLQRLISNSFNECGPRLAEVAAVCLGQLGGTYRFRVFTIKIILLRELARFNYIARVRDLRNKLCLVCAACVLPTCPSIPIFELFFYLHVDSRARSYNSGTVIALCISELKRPV